MPPFVNIPSCLGCVAWAVAGLLLMSAAADTARAEPAKTEAPVPTPVDMQKRMELYRKKLADYLKEEPAAS